MNRNRYSKDEDCYYFIHSHCTRENCNYRHDEAAKRTFHVCNKWQNKEYCDGNCLMRHSEYHLDSKKMDVFCYHEETKSCMRLYCQFKHRDSRRDEWKTRSVAAIPSPQSPNQQFLLNSDISPSDVHSDMMSGSDRTHLFEKTGHALSPISTAPLNAKSDQFNFSNQLENSHLNHDSYKSMNNTQDSVFISRQENQSFSSQFNDTKPNFYGSIFSNPNTQSIDKSFSPPQLQNQNMSTIPIFGNSGSQENNITSPSNTCQSNTFNCFSNTETQSNINSFDVANHSTPSSYNVLNPYGFQKTTLPGQNSNNPFASFNTPSSDPNIPNSSNIQNNTPLGRSDENLLTSSNNSLSPQNNNFFDFQKKISMAQDSNNPFEVFKSTSTNQSIFNPLNSQITNDSTPNPKNTLSDFNNRPNIFNEGSSSTFMKSIEKTESLVNTNSNNFYDRNTKNPFEVMKNTPLSGNEYIASSFQNPFENLKKTFLNQKADVFRSTFNFSSNQNKDELNSMNNNQLNFPVDNAFRINCFENKSDNKFDVINNSSSVPNPFQTNNIGCSVTNSISSSANRILPGVQETFRNDTADKFSYGFKKSPIENNMFSSSSLDNRIDNSVPRNPFSANPISDSNMNFVFTTPFTANPQNNIHNNTVFTNPFSGGFSDFADTSKNNQKDAFSRQNLVIESFKTSENSENAFGNLFRSSNQNTSIDNFLSSMNANPPIGDFEKNPSQSLDAKKDGKNYLSNIPGYFNNNTQNYIGPEVGLADNPFKNPFSTVSNDVTYSNRNSSNIDAFSNIPHRQSPTNDITQQNKLKDDFFNKQNIFSSILPPSEDIFSNVTENPFSSSNRGFNENPFTLPNFGENNENQNNSRADVFTSNNTFNVDSLFLASKTNLFMPVSDDIPRGYQESNAFDTLNQAARGSQVIHNVDLTQTSFGSTKNLQNSIIDSIPTDIHKQPEQIDGTLEKSYIPQNILVNKYVEASSVHPANLKSPNTLDTISVNTDPLKSNDGSSLVDLHTNKNLLLTSQNLDSQTAPTGNFFSESNESIERTKSSNSEIQRNDTGFLATEGDKKPSAVTFISKNTLAESKVNQKASVSKFFGSQDKEKDCKGMDGNNASHSHDKKNQNEVMIDNLKSSDPNKQDGSKSENQEDVFVKSNYFKGDNIHMHENPDSAYKDKSDQNHFEKSPDYVFDPNYPVISESFILQKSCDDSKIQLGHSKYSDDASIKPDSRPKGLSESHSNGKSTGNPVNRENIDSIDSRISQISEISKDSHNLFTIDIKNSGDLQNQTDSLNDKTQSYDLKINKKEFSSQNITQNKEKSNKLVDSRVSQLNSTQLLDIQMSEKNENMSKKYQGNSLQVFEDPSKTDIQLKNSIDPTLYTQNNQINTNMSQKLHRNDKSSLYSVDSGILNCDSIDQKYQIKTATGSYKPKGNDPIQTLGDSKHSIVSTFLDKNSFKGNNTSERTPSSIEDCDATNTHFFDYKSQSNDLQVNETFKKKRKRAHKDNESSENDINPDSYKSTRYSVDQETTELNKAYRKLKQSTIFQNCFSNPFAPGNDLVNQINEIDKTLYNKKLCNSPDLFENPAIEKNITTQESTNSINLSQNSQIDQESPQKVTVHPTDAKFALQKRCSTPQSELLIDRKSIFRNANMSNPLKTDFGASIEIELQKKENPLSEQFVSHQLSDRKNRSSQNTYSFVTERTSNNPSELITQPIHHQDSLKNFKSIKNSENPSVSDQIHAEVLNKSSENKQKLIGNYIKIEEDFQDRSITHNDPPLNTKTPINSYMEHNTTFKRKINYQTNHNLKNHIFNTFSDDIKKKIKKSQNITPQDLLLDTVHKNKKVKIDCLDIKEKNTFYAEKLKRLKIIENIMSLD